MSSDNPAPGFINKPDYRLAFEAYDNEVTVTLGKKVLARSSAAISAKEADYPEVFYIPRNDVNLAELHATETTSFCPFKGTARYWKANAVKANSPDDLDICWSYEDPFDEAGVIGSHIAFYSDRVTVTSS